jgi:hypothetical protein
MVAILMWVGAVLLGIGSLAFFAFGKLAVTIGSGGPMSQLFSDMGTFGAAIFLALAAGYVLLAICVVRLVHWARVATIVLLWVGLGLAAVGIFVSLPHPKITVLAWQLFVIAVDLSILRYLTRPQVKKVFDEHERHFETRVQTQKVRGQGEPATTVIHELSREASLELLTRAHFGRLACSRDGQPYVVPTYFAYNENCLYSFSTVGQKIEWMRANPLVCVEVEEVKNSRQWASVVVLGRFEELPDGEEWRGARELAHELLQRKALWWEPGYAKTILHGEPRPLKPVFYRIHVVTITGHRASSNPDNT